MKQNTPEKTLAPTGPKKPYQTPKLECHGTLEATTGSQSTSSGGA